MIEPQSLEPIVSAFFKSLLVVKESVYELPRTVVESGNVALYLTISGIESHTKANQI